MRTILKRCKPIDLVQGNASYPRQFAEDTRDARPSECHFRFGNGAGYTLLANFHIEAEANYIRCFVQKERECVKQSTCLRNGDGERQRE